MPMALGNGHVNANEDFAVENRATNLPIPLLAIIKGDYVGRAFVMNKVFIKSNYLVLGYEMDRQIVFTIWQ